MDKPDPKKMRARIDRFLVIKGYEHEEWLRRRRLYEDATGIHRLPWYTRFMLWLRDNW